MSRPGVITGARTSRRVASDASIVLIAGFLAIVGSFLNSVAADKYDRLLQARFVRGKGIRSGRDVRVLMISLGAPQPAVSDPLAHCWKEVADLFPQDTTPSIACESEQTCHH